MKQKTDLKCGTEKIAYKQKQKKKKKKEEK